MSVWKNKVWRVMMFYSAITPIPRITAMIIEMNPTYAKK